MEDTKNCLCCMFMYVSAAKSFHFNDILNFNNENYLGLYLTRAVGDE